MALRTSAAFGVTLEEAAFEQYERAVRAGCPLGITSSYRDPDLQVRLFHENYTRDYSLSAKYDGKRWGTVWYWRRRYNARTGGATVSVAVPGTSRHEYGLALDLPGSTADTRTPRGWMHRYGRPFGFFWPRWAQEVGTYEPWHIEFDRALVGIDTETDQEDDMTPEQEAKLDGLITIARRLEGDLTNGTRETRLTQIIGQNKFLSGKLDAQNVALKAISDMLAGAGKGEAVDYVRIKSIVDNALAGAEFTVTLTGTAGAAGPKA